MALALLEKEACSRRLKLILTRFPAGRSSMLLSRALAMSPEVILFDEPTSALDPERKGEVLLVMRNLSTEGYTMIVVTHEMDFARAVSDQVVFLDKGKIIEKAAPERFFTDPQTERLQKFLELVE